MRQAWSIMPKKDDIGSNNFHRGNGITRIDTIKAHCGELWLRNIPDCSQHLRDWLLKGILKKLCMQMIPTYWHVPALWRWESTSVTFLPLCFVPFHRIPPAICSALGGPEDRLARP